MFIGIDMGARSMGIGLVSDKGELSFDNISPIDSEMGLDKLMLDIIYMAKNISETVPLELFNDRILGIGIGIQDSSNLENSPVQEIVQKYFDVPVVVESHAVARALAEMEIGTLKGNINKAGIIAAGLLCIAKA